LTTVHLFLPCGGGRLTRLGWHRPELPVLALTRGSAKNGGGSLQGFRERRWGLSHNRG
jgi:hypothetical protein